MRFYDPSAGQILFNGAPIKKMPVDVLRQHIAIVTQEPVVFADTVLENIRYGSPHASDDAVINAAKQAFAHEFIDNLDERYNTQLGERGVNFLAVKNNVLLLLALFWPTAQFYSSMKQQVRLMR